MTKARLGIGSALLTICATGWSTPALAQDGASPGADPDSSDIVVTALKRPTVERDVPFALSSIGAEDLANRGIANSTDLGQVTPGLVISQNALFSQPTLRGVGTLSTAAGDEPNVTTYVDGIYQSQMFANLYEFNNIERIEVLKGPQGTLFGRNATGGAISIVTKQPKPGAIEGAAALSYGRFNEVRGSGYFATGLGGDFAADVAIVGSRDDGYVRDLVRGGRLADEHMVAARGKIRYAGAAADITLAADIADGEDRSGLSSQPLNRNTLGRALSPAVFIPTDPRAASLDTLPRNRVRQHGVSLTAEVPLGAIKLVSITSYRHSRLFGVVDTDATAVPVFSLVANQYSHSVSQELRLQSSAGAIDWIAGFFFYDDSSGYDPLALSNGAKIATNVATRAYAGFGEATVPLTRDVTLAAGLRYSWEHKRLTGGINGGAIVPAEASWDDFSPRISLRWAVAPKTILFLTASRGFKSGVFNSSSLSRVPVNPERLDTLEGGVKTAIGGLQLNVSAYRYWYKDIQVQAYDATTAISSLQNAASARMWGVDIDATVRPSRYVEFRMGANFLDAQYKDFPRASVTQPLPTGGNRQFSADASGNEVIRAPGTTISVGMNASQPLPSGELYLAGNLYFNSGFYWDPGNRVRQPCYAVLNLEAGWRADRAGRIKLSVWARNLTDSLYALTSQQSSIADTVNYARPRTFGVRAAYAF